MTESSNQQVPESYLQEWSSILSRAQKGDSVAEAAVHNRFVDKLIRVANRRINARFNAKIAAEEVVQSVFASFFRRHRNDEYRFDGWNDLWALLLRITFFKCSDRIAEFRTQKRDIQRELSWNGNSNEQDSSDYLCQSEPSAEEIAIFNDAIDQLFDRLNAQQQKVVGMRLQGMSNLEISQKIGRTERSVYRIHKQIQQIFEDLDPKFSSEA